MSKKYKVPAALTIAGSDCSGGAGLEADLKVFSAYQVYGMAAVTCVVAENPGKVFSIQPVSASILNDQIWSCLEGMNPVSVKTGMLYSKSLIEACGKALESMRKQIRFLTVDPVMVATSGTPLLRSDGIHAMRRFIEVHADLVTPNLDEAVILSGKKIRNEQEVEEAAEIIGRKYSCMVLLKGGHLKSRRWARDFFYSHHRRFWVQTLRIHGVQTHGTGCTYSAAITAALANGQSLEKSIRSAKKYLTGCIRNMKRFPHWMALGHF